MELMEAEGLDINDEMVSSLQKFNNFHEVMSHIGSLIALIFIIFIYMLHVHV